MRTQDMIKETLSVCFHEMKNNKSMRLSVCPSVSLASTIPLAKPADLIYNSALYIMRPAPVKGNQA